MAILLISLSIGTVIYYQTLAMVEDEVVNTNITVLDQSKDVLDRRFQEVESIAQRIADDSKVVSFQHVTDPYGGSNTYRILNTRNGLYGYSLSNNFIMGYHLLFKNSGLALGTKLTYSLPEFYRTILSYENMDYDRWYDEFLEKYHNKEYLPAMPASVREQPYSVVTYIQTLGYPNYFHGAIVVLIDNKQIQTLLSGLDTSDGGWAYIADDKGRMISSVSSGPQMAAPIQVSLSKASDVQEVSMNGARMLVTYTTSGYNGWKYVVVQPIHIVLQKVYYIKKILTAVLLASLTIGALIAFIMAYRNSKPLRNLIQVVAEQFEGERPHPPKDAYGFIEMTFSQLKENNNRLQMRIKEQLPVLRVALFERLLKGELRTDEDVETQLQHLGIPLHGDYYVVALLYLRGYDGTISKDILEEMEIKRMVVKDAIDSIVGSRGFLHDVEEDKIALLLTFGTSDTAAYRKEMAKLVRLVSDELAERFQLHPIVAVGDPHGNLVGISRSFEEARQALNYRARDKSDLIWYCELPRESIGYYYPNNVKLRLMNLAKAGKADEVERVLEELYAENVKNRHLSLHMLRFFMFELWGDIIKLVEHIRLEEEELGQVQAAANQIDSDSDLESSYRMARHIYDRICRAVDDRKKSHNTQLKNAMLELIRSRYADAGFGLAAASELLGVSEVYLSQFFKEQTGINFYEYLNNLRMEKARELLLQTDLSVNEITNKVGYNSSNAFGRAFKRSHGISPTLYRRSDAAE